MTTIIFCIHYFLWYAALTSIFGYEGVYARRYTNANTVEYGYLNMLLPFVTVLIAPLVCSRADRHRVHRDYFVLSIAIACISLGLYAFLPIAFNYSKPSAGITTEDHQLSGGLLVGPWLCYCLAALICDLATSVNTCLGDCFAVVQAEAEGTSFGRLIVWGTFGWASSAVLVGLLNQFKLMPPFTPGLMFGATMLAVDVLVVSFWTRSSDFKLDSIPISAANTLTGSTPVARKDPSDYQPLNESALVNLGPQIERDGAGHAVRKTLSPIQIVHQAQVGSAGQRHANSTNTTSTNTTATAPDSREPPKRELKKPTSLRMQLLLLGLICARRKTLLRYLLLFMFSGFFMSLHWNYYFLYLEQIYPEQFDLASSLSMVGQSLLGELPFFILSRKIIEYFGRSHTLTISVVSIGIRYFLYACLLSPNGLPYLVLLADCLQGPNYGLFYVVMAEVGLEYSYCDSLTIERLAAMGELDRDDAQQVAAVRLSLRSTVQSVAFACYEGLGVGLGSLFGGWMVAKHGYRTLWLSMSAAAIFVGLINELIEVASDEQLWRTTSSEDPNSNPMQNQGELSERTEFHQASRSGALQKLASVSSPLITLPKPGRTDRQIRLLLRKTAGPFSTPPVVPIGKLKWPKKSGRREDAIWSNKTTDKLQPTSHNEQTPSNLEP